MLVIFQVLGNSIRKKGTYKIDGPDKTVNKYNICRFSFKHGMTPTGDGFMNRDVYFGRPEEMVSERTSRKHTCLGHRVVTVVSPQMINGSFPTWEFKFNLHI